MRLRISQPWRAGRFPHVALGAVALLVGTLLAAPLQADMRDTKHNLARQFGRTVTDEREVCVFCHFPVTDGLEPGAQVDTPTWQRTAPGDLTFSIYDDIGREHLDGAKPVGSQSIACLSCHDSNQAFSVTNAAFDHPFGVPYRGTRASRSALDEIKARVRRAGTPMREAEFLFDGSSKDFRPVFESMVENRRVFWASASGHSSRRSKSDLPLYGRRSGADNEEIPFVECSSCHDPHSANPLFLRVSNTENQLCLTCHDM
jgi:predicted CXXCH cytochrome family protein